MGLDLSVQNQQSIKYGIKPHITFEQYQKSAKGENGQFSNFTPSIHCLHQSLCVSNTRDRRALMETRSGMKQTLTADCQTGQRWRLRSISELCGTCPDLHPSQRPAFVRAECSVKKKHQADHSREHLIKSQNNKFQYNHSCPKAQPLINDQDLQIYMCWPVCPPSVVPIWESVKRE